MKKLQKNIFLFVLVMIFTSILSGCNPRETKSFNKMEDFENAKIGVLLGSSFDILAKEYFPKADRLYFMNITDLILNLKQEKIDGILMDKGFFTPLAWEGENLSYIQMDMPATEYAEAFPKNKDSEKIKKLNNEYENVQEYAEGMCEIYNYLGYTDLSKAIKCGITQCDIVEKLIFVPVSTKYQKSKLASDKNTPEISAIKSEMFKILNEIFLFIR